MHIVDNVFGLIQINNYLRRMHKYLIKLQINGDDININNLLLIRFDYIIRLFIYNTVL